MLNTFSRATELMSHSVQAFKETHPQPTPLYFSFSLLAFLSPESEGSYSLGDFFQPAFDAHHEALSILSPRTQRTTVELRNLVKYGTYLSLQWNKNGEHNRFWGWFRPAHPIRRSDLQRFVSRFDSILRRLSDALKSLEDIGILVETFREQSISLPQSKRSSAKILADVGLSLEYFRNEVVRKKMGST